MLQFIVKIKITWKIRQNVMLSLKMERIYEFTLKFLNSSTNVNFRENSNLREKLVKL